MKTESVTIDLLKRRGRLLAILGAVLFVVSVAFPVAASIGSQEVQEAPPTWIGYLDVTLALVLVIVAVFLDVIARGKIDNHIIQLSYRIYRAVAILPLVLLVVFFLFGESIKWNVLLPGLAWRTWLLLYVLPAWIAAWEMSGHTKDRHPTGDATPDC